ncbi:MAG: formyltransferase family protein [Pricia sp.]
MRIALVGNNDGPLVLAKSMHRHEVFPVCVGLQKPANEELKQAYQKIIDINYFFSGFEEDALLKYLADYEIDVLINCFCNFKFKVLLEHYHVLNVHLAPLPKYRGRHPMHWALINGAPKFGVTVHRMDEAFDSGAILWQKIVPTVPGMSVAELRSVLMDVLAAHFGEFVVAYEKGDIEPLPNEDANATYAPRRYPEDSRLSEWQDRDTIFRKVMALRSEQNPAFLQVEGHDIPVLSANCIENEKSKEKSLSAASITALDTNGIQVLCKDGKRVELAGFNPEKFGLQLKQKLS